MLHAASERGDRQTDPNQLRLEPMLERPVAIAELGKRLLEDLRRLREVTPREERSSELEGYSGARVGILRELERLPSPVKAARPSGAGLSQTELDEHVHALVSRRRLEERPLKIGRGHVRRAAGVRALRRAPQDGDHPLVAARLAGE